MKKTHISLVIYFIISGVSNTVAGESSLYLGAGIGNSHFHGLNKIENVRSGVEDAATANLFVGYDLNNYLSLESGYLYLDHGKTDHLPFKNQGGSISLNGKVPLAGDLSLLAEAGGYWSHTEGLGTKDTKFSNILGVGLSYQINGQFDVQARWRYIKDVANINSEVYQTHFEPNENITTLELVYRPFHSIKDKPITQKMYQKTLLIQQQKAPETIIIDKAFEFDTVVYFGLNQTNLDAKGQRSLDKLYQQLSEIKEKKEIDIRIIGYSDSLGSNSVKDRVAKTRAEAVANYLALQKLTENPIRIQAHNSIDYACYKIKDKAKQIACLAPERRVEIKIKGYREVEEQSPW